MSLIVQQGPITCPADCEDLDIPAVLFTECDPETNLSQIAKIYIAKQDAADFSNWRLAAEWTARLSVDAVDPETIRPLTVIGDKPLPEITERTISGGRTVVTGGKQQINFDIDESNATNHEFARGTKCVKQVKFWYETIGGILFGGNTGIDATLYVNMVLSRTEGDIILYPGTLKWNNADVSERTTSPIA
jgi:hypothetical protein